MKSVCVHRCEECSLGSNRGYCEDDEKGEGKNTAHKMQRYSCDTAKGKMHVFSSIFLKEQSTFMESLLVNVRHDSQGFA